MKIINLDGGNYAALERLFCDYYAELGCDDDCAELVREYVLPDFEAGLLNIALAVEGDAVGFIIFQVDDIDNDWNFKEGWGDIRELYVRPNARKKGAGGALLSFAEKQLGGKIYLLPSEETEAYFIKRGYADNGEYCPELDNKVFVKE